MEVNTYKLSLTGHVHGAGKREESVVVLAEACRRDRLGDKDEDRTLMTRLFG